jgi:putative transposase
MGLRGRSIFGDQGHVFFVTTSLVNHEKIFGLGHAYNIILIESLNFVLEEHRAKLFAFVFMPSHVHLVVAMPEKENISDFMRDFKKFTSTKIRQQLMRDKRIENVERLYNNAQGKKNQIFKLWMDRFDDLVIENEETLRIKVQYIHDNPIRAGLVEQAEQWEFFPHPLFI